MLALLATCALSKEKGPGVTVTVSNVGTVTMHAIKVQLTGKSYAIGDLGPGASTSIAVHPVTDSHIVLVFDRTRSLTVDCYLEHGYTGKIAATVTAKRVVAVKAETRSSPF